MDMMGIDIPYFDIATSALEDEYYIIWNGYYTICGSTAKRVSCNRCVPCKGYMKYSSLKTFRLKSLHNDAKMLVVLKVGKWVEEQ